MHKSRLGGVTIDCCTDDLEAAASFWSQALGYPMKKSLEPGNENYVELDSGGEEVHIEVQRVDHASRVHLDLESNDVEAEVARLESLGAKRLRKVRTWWVMEAPTGHRFCVVRPQRSTLEEEGHTWSAPSETI